MLYTPRGLASIARKNGRRITGRTIAQLVKNGEIQPDAVLLGERGRLVALGFSVDSLPRIPQRQPGRQPRR